MQISIGEQVLGITQADLSDTDMALHIGYANATNQDLSVLEFEALRTKLTEGGTSWLSEHGEMAEAFLTMDGLLAILGVENHATANTLTCWPFYQHLIEQHGKRIGGTALMIGSNSPLSSLSFSELAKDVYLANKSIVVDLVGTSAHTEVSDFMRADGLRLPIATGSVDYVHTNLLLHQLVNPRSRLPFSRLKIRHLLEEVGRVLAPGGQLLMVERAPGIRERTTITQAQRKYRRLGQLMVNTLASEDFEQVYIGHPPLFENHEYLFDPRREFNKHATGTNVGMIVLHARKAE